MIRFEYHLHVVIHVSVQNNETRVLRDVIFLKRFRVKTHARKQLNEISSFH